MEKHPGFESRNLLPHSQPLAEIERGDARSAEPLNALSVDIEDWLQSTIDRSAPITSRVYDNTMRLLELFERAKTQATFFVLGLAAEAFPRLIQEIHGLGHEIASHGYSHQLVFRQSRQEFARDVQRSLELLEALTGCKVLGYRAPDFSISSTTLWALEVLEELNLFYDSSIFPVRNPHYGIPDWPRPPLSINNGSVKRLVEFPISALRIGRTNVPFIGGGYTRLWPSWFIEWGIRRLHQEGLPVLIYMHPYEINPDEFDALEVKISLKQKIHQGMNRRKVYGKTGQFLEKFKFAPVREVLRERKLLPEY